MSPPSWSAAFPMTSSTESDGVTTSSRRMLSSSIVCAVGGDVVGRDGRQDRVLVEDVVELPFEERELVIAKPEAGEMGDVLDVGA